MLMIVARPIGKVPRKRLCAGWRTIEIHILGYSEYRRTEMMRKMMNKTTFSAKRMYDMYCSQRPLYGRFWSRMDVMPVPMFTENQEGVKFRIILRHPRCRFNAAAQMGASPLSIAERLAVMDSIPAEGVDMVGGY
jgi:hypothetical protein